MDQLAFEGRIAVEDPGTPDILALLHQHLAFARASSPPQDVHALDLDGLRDPRITFFACRRQGVLLGVGALKTLEPQHLELKSMHTAQASRGQGVGLALVQHLIAVARARGIRRISLETGTMDAFAPARALYARAGFVPCPPFEGYRPSPSSTFMTLSLAR